MKNISDRFNQGDMEKRTSYIKRLTWDDSLRWHDSLLVSALPRAGLASKIALSAAAVLMLWGMAKVSFFLPGNPTVPVTLQTLGIVLVGGFFGLRWGVVTVLAYYLVGLAGLPVFGGDSAGVSYISGATGGYLVGFILAAAVTGLLAQLGVTHLRSIWSVLVGSLFVYLPGLVWLSFFIDADQVLARGFYPFLVGDFLKVTVSGLALALVWRLADWRRASRDGQK